MLGSYLPDVEYIPNVRLDSSNSLGSRSYIIFGTRKKNGFAGGINIGSPGSNGLYAEIASSGQGGLVPDTMTRSVTPIGDLNGDSLADLLVCTPVNAICYVYLGNDYNQFTNLQVSFVLKSTDDLFGFSAAALNDINRDGFHDFAISATGSNIIYIVYGSVDLQKNDIDMSSFNISSGIKIIGSANDINTGLCVSSAGDFNNDSFPDLIFSAIQVAPSYQNMIYLLFGSANQRQRDIRIDQLSADAFVKIVSVPSYFAGLSLSGVGDINNDGYDDIIIGSVPYQGSYREQKSYVICGRNHSATKTFVSHTIQLSELREDEGFIITGGGFAVAGIGDVNEDGINDFMVSSYSDWHGKGNAFLMVYPTNISAPPTFLPSSSPSSFPSSQPSSVPTEKKPQTSFPSSLPSFKSQSHSTELLTAPPWVTKTDSPSLAPKTNKPSRSPTFRPTSGSPTVKPSNTHSPTTSKPTRRPTVIPTIVPSANVVYGNVKNVDRLKTRKDGSSLEDSDFLLSEDEEEDDEDDDEDEEEDYSLGSSDSLALDSQHDEQEAEDDHEERSGNKSYYSDEQDDRFKVDDHHHMSDGHPDKSSLRSSYYYDHNDDLENNKKLLSYSPQPIDSYSYSNYSYQDNYNNYNNSYSYYRGNGNNNNNNVISNYNLAPRPYDNAPGQFSSDFFRPSQNLNFSYPTNDNHHSTLQSSHDSNSNDSYYQRDNRHYDSITNTANEDFPLPEDRHVIQIHEDGEDSADGHDGHDEDGLR
jgi:hypothetical protein